MTKHQIDLTVEYDTRIARVAMWPAMLLGPDAMLWVAHRLVRWRVKEPRLLATRWRWGWR